MGAERRQVRCAIYTRKSSEEGLEQSFNSLDAQREACAAYIESQRHEGWKALEAQYNDGGYSGGSMERPALEALLSDLQAGRLDVVVVYKVDRLTRSLADFAKIVELFDRHKVSFVSVTQQFNTTSSMGRLTLNVLLSFAQFEREVTGERIRDKIAASKKKGMWMGGSVPLGYDLKERKLLVNKTEATLVRRIFDRYLALGCVRKLRADLIKIGVKSKVRVSRAGRKTGGVTYSRGALYEMLRNRLYIGEIAHRGAVHPGLHEALIPTATWERVQELLRSNNQARRLGVAAKTPSLLAGLLFDREGNRLTPLHSNKGGKRYRYYTSQSVIRNGPEAKSGVPRIPAADIESLVTTRLSKLLGLTKEVLEATASSDASAQIQQKIARSGKAWALRLPKLTVIEGRAFLARAVSQIIVTESDVTIHLPTVSLRDLLLGEDVEIKTIDAKKSRAAMRDDVFIIRVEAQFARKTGAVRMIVPAAEEYAPPRRQNDVLLKAIARGRRWYEMLVAGEVESMHALAKVTGLHERYVGRILRCAFLSPVLVEQILDGKQSASLTLDRLLKGIPPGWKQQENQFTA